MKTAWPVELHTLQGKLIKTTNLENELTENDGSSDDIDPLILKAYEAHFPAQADKLRRQSGDEGDMDLHKDCSQNSISSQTCDSPYDRSFGTQEASADEIVIGNNDNDSDIIVPRCTIRLLCWQQAILSDQISLVISQKDMAVFFKRDTDRWLCKVWCCDDGAFMCSKSHLHLKMLQFSVEYPEVKTDEAEEILLLCRRVLKIGG